MSLTLSSPHSIPTAAPDPAFVLAKAVVRAAQALGLSQADLATVIGLSPASVSRLKDGALGLSGKPFELAACLVRVFRSLDAIVGGDRASMAAWMQNPNTDLNATPRDAIRDVAGLVAVMDYLDARRGKL